MAPMTGIVIKDWSVDSIKLGLPNLTGKHLLVIGGTSGIGRAIALQSCIQGAYVTVVGRRLRDEDVSVKNLSFVSADLSTMANAKALGETVCSGAIKDIDVILFSNGIVPKAVREENAEGLELDMAVSYLSRLVMLKYMVPRLSRSKKVRIFIIGFPGANQSTYRIDDLNAEKDYEGGFGFVSMNTVIGNESLVVHSASKSLENQVLYFGLNPGLIKTGIRSSMWEGSWLSRNIMGPFVETMIGVFSHSPEAYAKKMVPLLFAPELDDHNGSFFNPKAQPIHVSKFFVNDKDFAKKFIEASEALIKEKTGLDLP